MSEIIEQPARLFSSLFSDPYRSLKKIEKEKNGQFWRLILFIKFDSIFKHLNLKKMKQK